MALSGGLLEHPCQNTCFFTIFLLLACIAVSLFLSILLDQKVNGELLYFIEPV